jgi:hypothetical protein
VQTFTINLPERDPNAEQIHASMNQLASCSLRPRKLDVVGGSFNYASFFAVPEYRHVWSKVEVFCDNTDSEVPLLQASSAACSVSAATGQRLMGRKRHSTTHDKQHGNELTAAAAGSVCVLRCLHLLLACNRCSSDSTMLCYITEHCSTDDRQTLDCYHGEYLSMQVFVSWHI